MHRPHYVVLHMEEGWRIKQAGRRFADSYASKTLALGAAIQLAERDGEAGRFAEVMVLHEDEHFVTEWIYGRDAHSGKAARSR